MTYRMILWLEQKETWTFHDLKSCFFHFSDIYC
jgi:hypothetical protein